MTTPTPQNNSRPDASRIGEGLSNNLLSDLAPLLALFGEQVTKPFLAMSMDWTDNILIALGPLGIMTILVSAIRIAGIKRLKALIGRARESRETAEVELLSPTPYGVREMWNGFEIVRSFGIPATSQFVIVRNDDGIYIYCPPVKLICRRSWLRSRDNILNKTKMRLSIFSKEPRTFPRIPLGHLSRRRNNGVGSVLGSLFTSCL
jgi:hypothetical protein